MSLGSTLADLMLAVLRDSAETVRVHVADPGSDGLSGPALNTEAQPVTFGDPSAGVVSNDADVTWLSVAGTETYTHISTWGAGSTFLWAGALVAPQDVVAGDDFTLSVGMIVASVS